MKLVCAQETLSSKLALLSRIVPNNPSHPVLANVLMHTSNGRLGLTVFDLSVGMQVWMSADVEEEGSLRLFSLFRFSCSSVVCEDCTYPSMTPEFLADQVSGSGEQLSRSTTWKDEGLRQNATKELSISSTTRIEGLGRVFGWTT